MRIELSNSRKLWRFCVVGVLNTLVDFALFNLLVLLLSRPDGIALLACAMCGTLRPGAAIGASSEAAGNPYKAIAVRNVFGLKPPPPPPDNTPPAPPPPQVELVGIAEVFGVKKALVKIAEGAKPVDMTKDPTVVLEEGQRERDVEILKIDQDRASVKVRNRGNETVLVFNKDKTKLPSAPVTPTLPPGVTLPPGFTMPAGGAIPAPTGSTPTPIIPSLPMPAVTAPGTMQPAGSVSAGVDGQKTVNLPHRPLGLPPSWIKQPAPAPVPSPQ